MCVVVLCSGAVHVTDSQSWFTSCNFTDCGLQLQDDRDIDLLRVTDRMGGAMAAGGGTIAVDRCAFTRVSALPHDLQRSSCAKV